jgi:hypothetical protein
MLRLAARYADLWNRSSGYPTIPATREEFLAGMDEACSEIGRDVSTLGLTVRMFIGFPNAGPMPSILPEGSYINGKDGAAATLRAYAGLGASLAFCQIYPCNEAALEELAEGVALARAGR